MKPTMEQLRIATEKRKEKLALEKARLKEKVLCAEITFPKKMQEQFGINGYTMKASEVEEWVLNELECSDITTLNVQIKYSMRTNKWIESLPEADL